MRHTTLVCPWCHNPNNRHPGADPHAVPGQGDVLVCWPCGGVGVVDVGPVGELISRKPTPAEAGAIFTDPQIIQARKDRKIPGVHPVGAAMRMRRRAQQQG